MGNAVGLKEKEKCKKRSENFNKIKICSNTIIVDTTPTQYLTYLNFFLNSQSIIITKLH